MVEVCDVIVTVPTWFASGGECCFRRECGYGECGFQWWNGFRWWKFVSGVICGGGSLVVFVTVCWKTVMCVVLSCLLAWCRKQFFWDVGSNSIGLGA